MTQGLLVVRTTKILVPTPSVWFWLIAVAAKPTAVGQKRCNGELAIPLVVSRLQALGRQVQHNVFVMLDSTSTVHLVQAAEAARQLHLGRHPLLSAFVTPITSSTAHLV